MSADRYERIESIFFEAVGVAPDDRAALLADRCADDAALRAEVERLLAIDDSTVDFLAESPLTSSLLDVASSPALGAGGHAEGDTVGPYRLVRRIGRGGMGEVWLAERADGAFEHQVAIKLIRRGLDTDDILARFRNERQVLASLQHPNIARLLDGGATANGRPYLVMEHVDGESITRHCADCGLSIEERVDLLRDVCGAVQHAHGRLVVHRDLKPGNILVDGAGAPRLLDFGIARVLDDDTGGVDMTATAERRFTPMYASPEQVRGDALTTATDVYSLGVVLYELLTNRMPYDLASRPASEHARMICETDPRRPSEVATGDTGEHGDADTRRWRRRLTGDLDTIVMTALRKEPERRYASVEQFAEDLRRYRAGLPVRARRDTLAYRTVKLVRRNRVVVLAGLAVIAALVIGMAVGVTQYMNATKEREIAQARFGEVRELANTLLFEVDEAIARLAGATPARAIIVERGLSYLDGLAADAGDDRDLTLELASGYRRMSEIQGATNIGGIGDLDGALASAERARDLYGGLSALDPDDLDAAFGAISATRLVGDALTALGRGDEARAVYGEQVAAARTLAQRHPTNGRARRASFLASFKLGSVGERLGDLEEAGAHYADAVEIATGLLAEDPENPRATRDALLVHNRVSRVLRLQGDLDGAAAALDRATRLAETAVTRDPSNAQLQTDLALCHERLGDLALERDDVATALDHYGRRLTTALTLLASDPRNGHYRNHVSIGHEKIGDAHLAAEDYEAARAAYQAALDVARAQAVDEPENADVRFGVAISLVNVGLMQRHLGALVAAERNFGEAVELAIELIGRDPQWFDPREALAVATLEIARLRTEDGRSEDALTGVEVAMTLMKEPAESQPEQRWVVDHLARYHRTLAEIRTERADDDRRAVAERLSDLDHAAASLEALIDLAERAEAAGFRDRIDLLPASAWRRELDEVEIRIRALPTE